MPSHTNGGGLLMPQAWTEFSRIESMTTLAQWRKWSPSLPCTPYVNRWATTWHYADGSRLQVTRAGWVRWGDQFQWTDTIASPEKVRKIEATERMERLGMGAVVSLVRMQMGAAQ